MPRKMLTKNAALLAIENLRALLKHYDLEQFDDPWPLLAFELAWDFVPGFAPARKRGRPKGPKTWTAEKRDQLIAAVQAVRSEKKGRTITEAIRLLKQREPKRWPSLNSTRYHEAVRDRKDRDETRKALAAGDYWGPLKKQFRF
jgi:hypothetical protein